MYVGETEKRLKEVFALALKKAPCILFIDELDSLCQARSRTDSSGDLISEIKELVAQCCNAAMDGLQRVLLIGATNRPSVVDEVSKSLVKLLMNLLFASFP